MFFIFTEVSMAEKFKKEPHATMEPARDSETEIHKQPEHLGLIKSLLYVSSKMVNYPTAPGIPYPVHGFSLAMKNQQALGHRSQSLGRRL